MLRKLLTLVLLCALCSTLYVTDAQSNFTPTLCTNASGAYYRDGLFPNFTDANNRLVLEDWHTKQIVTVLADKLPYTYSFQWSPDCHYLIGISLHYKDFFTPCDAGLFVWDTV